MSDQRESVVKTNPRRYNTLLKKYAEAYGPACDVFFHLLPLTLTNMRKVLHWAQPRSARIDVDVLDCSKSWRRTKANIGFDDVVKRMTRACAPFFRIMLRKQWNTFLILHDHKNIQDLLEIGVRSVHRDSSVNSPEYFIFMYLQPRHLDDLKKEFDIRPYD